MNFNIEYEQEEDGHWLAELTGLPGVLAYGDTPDEAMIKAEALALRVLAEKLEQEESRPQAIVAA
ncbi:MAG: type II toxin-antitoxin system HicB family antitoxin [Gammaproteobacteria bacterium]|nr:type II toxin-antitoxin system HicB family antitoxin [Gammaproteobacteria bacterium]